MSCLDKNDHPNFNCCKHPCPKGVILACGREVDEVDQEFRRADLPLRCPVVLAKLFIDTTSLCKPLVKIDFSTLIRYEDNSAVPIILTFKLFRQCGRGCKEELESYKFQRGTFADGFDPNINVSTRDSFGFTFCDDELCFGECCIYTVELTEVQITSTGQTIVNNIKINKSAINAIAQDLCECEL